MPNLHWGSNYSFAAYTVKHAAVLVALTVAATAVVAVGRRIPSVPRRAFERIAGIMIVGMWLCGSTWDAINPHNSPSTTFPFHWCDLTGGLAWFVMFAPQFRVPRAMLHFWALGICSFAFAVPAIGQGPALPDFWFYFGTHSAIVLTAVYDCGVRGFRPGVRDIGYAWTAATLWTLILQPINLITGSNYGFVGPNDLHVRKAILALGAWPWRVAPMLAIELAIMFAVLGTQRLISKVIQLVSPRRETPPLPMTYTMVNEGEIRQAA